MTQNEVSIIKNAVLDATEAYVDARLSAADFVKTQIGVVREVTKNSKNKYEHTVVCNKTVSTSGIIYTKVLSIGNIEFPPRSVVFLLAPNSQFSNQFILGKLDDTTFRVDEIAIGGTASNPAFYVDRQGNLSIGGSNIFSNPEFKVDKSGNVTIKKGSININNNTFMVNSDGTMQARKCYIGSSSYGFTVSQSVGIASLWTIMNGQSGPTSSEYLTPPNAGSCIDNNGFITCRSYWANRILNSQFVTYYDSAFVWASAPTSDGGGTPIIGRDGRYVPWTGGSDIKLKKNINPIENTFVRDLFKKVNPVKFNYIYDKEEHTEFGLIAQDLEKVFEDIKEPNNAIVSENESLDENKYKVINYQKMVGLLIPAVKDLYELVEKQQSQINELKSEIENLRKED